MEIGSGTIGTTGAGKALAAFLAISFISMLLMGCLGSSSTQTSPTTMGTGPQLPTTTQASQIATSTTLTTADNSNTSTTVQQTVAATVANGVYTDNEQYAYHAGVNTVNISVEVENGIITNASVTPVGNVDAFSQGIISNFNAAISSPSGPVIGQPIATLSLPHNVAGSSLTNAAFQQYVAGINAGTVQVSS